MLEGAYLPKIRPIDSLVTDKHIASRRLPRSSGAQSRPGPGTLHKPKKGSGNFTRAYTHTHTHTNTNTISPRCMPRQSNLPHVLVLPSNLVLCKKVALSLIKRSARFARAASSLARAVTGRPSWVPGVSH